MRVVVACCLVLVLGGTAAADRATALMYFRAGEKAYRAQNFEAAARNFDEAFKELPLPEIAFSAAQAYRRQYRVDPQRLYAERAVALYEAYLQKVKRGGRVRDAADALGELKVELAKLGDTPVAPVAPAAEQRTELGITVNLVGVALTDAAMREVEDSSGDAAVTIITRIDGTIVEADDMHPVEPGEHVVRAEAPGFKPAEKRTVAPKGKANMVELDLQPLPAVVTIRSEAGAKIHVGDRAVTAGTPIEVPAGRHVVRIARPGRIPIAKQLDVSRGQQMEIDQPLEPTLRRKAVKFVAGAAIGLGVISLVTGGAAVAQDRQASNRLATLESGGQDPALLVDYASARELRDQLVIGTWVSGATAIGVGLAAGYLYYFDTPSSEGIRVTPIAGSGVGGAQVIGRF